MAKQLKSLLAAISVSNRRYENSRWIFIITNAKPPVHQLRYILKKRERKIMKSFIKKTTIKGKRIAVTGALIFYKRKEVFALIRALGGIPQSHVTQETDYLVVGYYRKNSIKGNKSRKRICAERYISQGRNLRIIKEEDFLPMLWYSSSEHL